MAIFQSSTVTVERDADGSFVLVLDVPGRSVNLITAQVLTDLDAALDVLASQRIPVLVIRGGKKSGFLAGADIAEFTRIPDAAAARELSARGQQLFDKLAGLSAPSVAVVHGPCLGGGLELALACDYRLVFDRPGTQLGLPEVELGLLPAWGGTQRLARVVGLERALQVILSGKRLSAREAFAWKLADALASDEANLRTEYGRLVLRAVGEGKRRRDRLPLTTWRQWFLESNLFGRKLIFQGTERILRNRVPDDMPAPQEAFDAVRLGVQRGVPAGLERERDAAARLALSPACKNLIELFFAREAARKLPAGLPEARSVKRLGVVGAGVMGAGIAQLAALSGVEVVLQEVNQAALTAGLARLDDLFSKAAGRGRYSAREVQERRQAVRGTLSWEGFERVDLVVEAALEDLEVKRNLFIELERRVQAATVLATNTSSLAVSRLLEGRSHPERIAGLHFFNPVHKMPLVEVIHTAQTSPETIALLMRFSIDLGKTPVQVGDGPGFVVNRILMPYLDEAVTLVGEGLPVKDIDRLMRRFGMPMGPLELLDQIGLDVAAHVGRMVQQQLGTMEASPIYEKLRERGWLGQKSGQGFYLYPKKGSPVPHAAAERLVREGRPAPLSTLPLAARLADARDRLVLGMVNEAARVLGAGLVRDAATLDLAMVLGTGWAPHRGGPLHYAAARGFDEVVRALENLASRLGPRFAPAEALKSMAGARVTS